MTKKTGTRLPAIAIVVVVAAVIVAALWVLRARWTAEDDTRTGRSTSAGITSEQVKPIVGRWRRPDGGYIIEIRGLLSGGNLDVGYFNPRSINVAQAQVVQGADGLSIFIELRDTGYPGATYSLEYDGGNDVLTGIYFQPSVNQSFDVVFDRVQ